MSTPERINLDLVELLTDRHTLFEINAVVGGDNRHVQVLYTDPEGNHSAAVLSREDAGTLGAILTLFDWRALKELGASLTEGAAMLAEKPLAQQ